MAYKTLFLMALVFFQAINPLAQAQILPIQGLTVTGQLCCTNGGTCPGLGVPGAVVSLNCTDRLRVTTTIGQNTTNINGFFNITVLGRSEFVRTLPIPCVAVVQLPLNSTVCPVLNTTTGILMSTLSPAFTLVPTTVGLIMRTRIIGFFRVEI